MLKKSLLLASISRTRNMSDKNTPRHFYQEPKSWDGSY